MHRKMALITIIGVSLISMACTIVNLPVRRFKTGPTVTEDIRVPAPDGGGEADVTVSMGAGTLSIKPGAQDALVEGTVTYNVKEFQPETTTRGTRISIEQGEIKGVPNARNMGEVVNEWDLRLGASPMALTVNAGAASADVELGGLSLTGLTVNQGASELDLAFSESNLSEMSVLRLNAGASRAGLTGLANANAAKIVLKGGAGDYALEFSGSLTRDVHVSVEAGVGRVTLTVPEGVPAVATFEGALTNINVGGDWERSGDTYTLEGDGPKVTFEIKMGVGNLELQSQ